ncbi:hydrolase [Chlamydiales bacterium]|nr:hydrolase [Chlamydiales bacterium]
MDKDALLKQLILWAEINSFTENLEGLNKMKEIFIEAFSPISDEIEDIPLPAYKKISLDGEFTEQKVGSLLSFKRHGTSKRKILLVGHMDTVYSLNNSFPIEIKGDNLHGPGVADMKGGILIMLYALLQLEKAPNKQSIGWEVLLTPDEEVGSPSSTAVIIEKAKGATEALVFEPALPDGSLVSTRPASCIYTLVIKGQAAHVGRHPEEGKNAINALSELIYQLSFLQNLEEKKLINVGMIQGGRAINMVPDHAVAKLNIRAQTTEEIHLLINIGKELSSEISNRYGTSTEWIQQTIRPAKQITPKTNQLMRAFQLLDSKLTFSPTGGVCDGNTLASLNIPTIDTLGPIGHHLHSHKEFLEIPSLFKRAELVTQFLLSCIP